MPCPATSAPQVRQKKSSDKETDRLQQENAKALRVQAREAVLDARKPESGSPTAVGPLGVTGSPAAKRSAAKKKA